MLSHSLSLTSFLSFNGKKGFFGERKSKGSETRRRRTPELVIERERERGLLVMMILRSVYGREGGCFLILWWMLIEF